MRAALPEYHLRENVRTALPEYHLRENVRTTLPEYHLRENVRAALPGYHLRENVRAALPEYHTRSKDHLQPNTTCARNREGRFTRIPPDRKITYLSLLYLFYEPHRGNTLVLNLD